MKPKEKVCKYCGKKFIIDKFHPSYQQYCSKQCKSRGYYQQKKEFILKQVKKYQFINKEEISIKKKAKYIQDKFEIKKVKARNIIAGLLRKKELIRPNRCSICNILHLKIEAHHPDYDKPYYIIWVCPKCHRNLHNPNKNEKYEQRKSY